MKNRVILNSNNVVEVRSLRLATDGTAITDATVQVTLKDANDAAVGGQSWPLTLPHVSGGTYRATMDDTVDVTAGSWYRVDVTVTTPGGNKRRWIMPVPAEYDMVY